MYLNRWVLLMSFIAGIAGLVVLTEAFIEYRDTVRSYSQVAVTHDPNSVVWDEANASLTMRLSIANRSPLAVTVNYLDLGLYVDDVFVGSDYDDWQPFTIGSMDSAQRTVTLEVSNSELRDQVDQANLQLRGEVRLRFDEVERLLTQRVNIALGRITAVSR